MPGRQYSRDGDGRQAEVYVVSGHSRMRGAQPTGLDAVVPLDLVPTLGHRSDSRRPMAKLECIPGSGMPVRYSRRLPHVTRLSTHTGVLVLAGSWFVRIAALGALPGSFPQPFHVAQRR
jgi:hypothetical protein